MLVIVYLELQPKNLKNIQKIPFLRQVRYIFLYLWIKKL